MRRLARLVSLVRLSHFMSAHGVSNVTSSRHLFCGRNCARGLPGCRKAGVRGCWDPRAVRRWQVGGGIDGHSSAGPLRRTRPPGGSGGFDRTARPLTTASNDFHRWHGRRARGEVTAQRSHDWTFHTVDRRVHPLARGASRGSPDRHPYDSAIAAQPPVQSRPAISRSAPRRNSVHPPGRVGRRASAPSAVSTWENGC